MASWRRLDLAPADEARALLERCCGSPRWVDRMLGRRPFGSEPAMLQAARDEWFALSEADWREAFAHHPRIGDRDALARRFAATRHLSSREQSGVNAAPETTLAALADRNAAYEARFGYIFIVCATGRTAEEMLALLEERLGHRPEDEIRIAAEEQSRITTLRLLELR